MASCSLVPRRPVLIVQTQSVTLVNFLESVSQNLANQVEQLHNPLEILEYGDG